MQGNVGRFLRLAALWAVIGGMMFTRPASAQPSAINPDGVITEPDWNLLDDNLGGPNPGFGNGHIVNALYSDNDANALYIGVAGDVQNGNRILVFIDSRQGGYNTGNFGRASAPQGIDDFNSGTSFDSGFTPDYVLVIGTNASHNNFFFDLYTLSGTANPSNGGGPNVYLGDVTDPDLGASPASGTNDTTHGFEVRLTYSSTGNGTDIQLNQASVNLFAAYISDGGFLSNQFISPAGPNDGNYESGAVTFGAAAPNPVTYTFVPTAVTLAHFEATDEGDHVRVGWETVSEWDNRGFNLYRSTSETPPATPLNPELIPSQVPGSGQGAAYEWLDLEGAAGATYFYWLEDVSSSGATTLHGPISLTRQPATAVTVATVAARQERHRALPLALGGLAMLAGVALWRRRA